MLSLSVFCPFFFIINKNCCVTWEGRVIGIDSRLLFILWFDHPVSQSEKIFYVSFHFLFSLSFIVIIHVRTKYIKQREKFYRVWDVCSDDLMRKILCYSFPNYLLSKYGLTIASEQIEMRNSSIRSVLLQKVMQ